MKVQRTSFHCKAELMLTCLLIFITLFSGSFSVLSNFSLQKEITLQGFQTYGIFSPSRSLFAYGTYNGKFYYHGGENITDPHIFFLEVPSVPTQQVNQQSFSFLNGIFVLL